MHGWRAPRPTSTIFVMHFRTCVKCWRGAGERLLSFLRNYSMLGQFGQGALGPRRPLDGLKKEERSGEGRVGAKEGEGRRDSSILPLQRPSNQKDTPLPRIWMFFGFFGFYHLLSTRLARCDSGPQQVVIAALENNNLALRYASPGLRLKIQALRAAAVSD